MLSLCFPLLLMTALVPASTIAIPLAPLVVVAQLAPEAASADAAPEVPGLEEAPGIVMKLIQAIQDKDWKLMVALIIMLLLVIANSIVMKFLPDDKRKIALPWIAVGTSCLLFSASVLIAGGSWWDAILAGFVTGAAATGLWELVGRHIKKLIAKKTKNPPPTASER